MPPTTSSWVSSPASFLCEVSDEDDFATISDFFATIVQHFCYIVSGEVSGKSPTRYVCILGEPFLLQLG
jgi:hypothetical protein